MRTHGAKTLAGSSRSRAALADEPPTRPHTHAFKQKRRTNFELVDSESSIEEILTKAMAKFKPPSVPITSKQPIRPRKVSCHAPSSSVSPQAASDLPSASIALPSFSDPDTAAPVPPSDPGATSIPTEAVIPHVDSSAHFAATHPLPTVPISRGPRTSRPCRPPLNNPAPDLLHRGFGTTPLPYDPSDRASIHRYEQSIRS